MNKFQDVLYFKFAPTSPKRRYHSFENHEFDLIMFEDVAWGWRDRPVSVSDVLLRGGEVYITKANEKKDQSYFDDFDGKSIAVILGYHYGFNDFDADEIKLKQRYDIQFNTDQWVNIKKIIADRVDISVVSLSYLNNYLAQHPAIKNQLLISNKLDQEYKHTFLLRNDALINIKQVNKLIADMCKAGVLDKVFKKYGIEKHIEEHSQGEN